MHRKCLTFATKRAFLQGFPKLWSVFGSFQPFITNDTVESSNRGAIFSWKFNAPQCQLCQAKACFIIGSILRGRALYEAGKSVLILIAFVDAGDVRSRWAIMSKGAEPIGRASCRERVCQYV